MPIKVEPQLLVIFGAAGDLSSRKILPALFRLATRDLLRRVVVLAVDQSAEETYAITNNHFRGQALVNALEILEELDAGPVAVPPLLAESFPDRFSSHSGTDSR